MSEEIVREMTREELMAERKELRKEIEEHLAEIQKLKTYIEGLEVSERALEKSCQLKDGLIEGLKFAVRCNGVSVGEVR